MAWVFEIKRDDIQYYVRFTGNGQELFSTQPVSTIAECKDIIETIRMQTPNAGVDDGSGGGGGEL